RLLETIVIDPDPKAFRAALEEGGFLHPGAPITDEEVVEFFGHFYHFVIDDRGTLGKEYASDTARRIFQLDGRHPGIQHGRNEPAPYVVLQRINLGLYAVLGQLRASAPWRGISEELWPWVDGPASTRQIGRAH